MRTQPKIVSDQRMPIDVSCVSRRFRGEACAASKLSNVKRLLRSEPPRAESEPEVFQKFRPFGVRFIRNARDNLGCDCQVPFQLLDWLEALNDISTDLRPPLALYPNLRFDANVKQDFRGDPFGELQFQDFWRARERRGAYHAMIHFAGIFANVGYDGVYWYWVLGDECETMPFLESKHLRRTIYIESLETMVRQQFRLNRHQRPVCPQPASNSSSDVRSEEADMPKDVRPEKIALHQRSESLRLINGQRAPQALSYSKLYCDEYYAYLATLGSI